MIISTQVQGPLFRWYGWLQYPRLFNKLVPQVFLPTLSLVLDRQRTEVIIELLGPTLDYLAFLLVVILTFVTTVVSVAS